MRTADAVDAALAKAKGPTEKYAALLVTRDAIEMPWERDFASLKRSARYAEEEGKVKGLYKSLFAEEPSTKAPAKKKEAAKKGAKKKGAEPGKSDDETG